VALGRPPAAFRTDQDAWGRAGPLNPDLRLSWPEAQIRTGPQNGHGPAPEDCGLSLQIGSMTLGVNVLLRCWKFHAQVQRALIAKHPQRQ
jgi:hypothetical protein